MKNMSAAFMHCCACLLLVSAVAARDNCASPICFVASNSFQRFPHVRRTSALQTNMVQQGHRGFSLPRRVFLLTTAFAIPSLLLRPASALTEAEEFEKLQRRAAELKEIFESQKAANSNLPTLRDSVAKDKVAKSQDKGGGEPDAPKLLPSPSFSSEEVAKMLISAMQKNDKPAPDSGLKAVLRFSSEKNPVKMMPQERFFDMMKNSKYSILLGDEYSFSVAKADEGVSKEDGEPFHILDVKIKAPYKKMLMNGMQFEDFESIENDKENVQVSMRWQFSKSKQSNCWLSDTLYVVSSSKNDAWRALV